MLASLSFTLILALLSWSIHSVFSSTLEKICLTPPPPSSYCLIFSFTHYSKPWDQFLSAASIFLFSLKPPLMKPLHPVAP